MRRDAGNSKSPQPIITVLSSHGWPTRLGTALVSTVHPPFAHPPVRPAARPSLWSAYRIPRTLFAPHEPAIITNQTPTGSTSRSSTVAVCQTCARTSLPALRPACTPDVHLSLTSAGLVDTTLNRAIIYSTTQQSVGRPPAATSARLFWISPSARLSARPTLHTSTGLISRALLYGHLTHSIDLSRMARITTDRILPEILSPRHYRS